MKYSFYVFPNTQPVECSCFTELPMFSLTIDHLALKRGEIDLLADYKPALFNCCGVHVIIQNNKNKIKNNLLKIINHH